THLGPERQHRTPDAAIIDATGATAPALRTTSGLLLTAAVASEALARRAAECGPAAAGPSPPVQRIRREGFALVGPAAQLHDRARDLTAIGADALGPLAAAPTLTVPENKHEDPRVRLHAALARLRVAAHLQGRGELVAGVRTIRAVSAVAVGLVRHELQGSATVRPP
ncbi:MAG: hypothetical protein QOE19_2217, partial [Actinomycetota bacterium]|nr:hypothetical protein [Actinomycetota bacterium]